MEILNSYKLVVAFAAVGIVGILWSLSMRAETRAPASVGEIHFEQTAPAQPSSFDTSDLRNSAGWFLYF